MSNKQKKYCFSKDNGWNPVLEFQMLGFVMPNSHACKGSYRTAQYGKWRISEATLLILAMLGLPFVNTIRQKGNDIDENQYDA